MTIQEQKEINKIMSEHVQAVKELFKGKFIEECIPDFQNGIKFV